jgi:hypothetical protein
MSRRGCLVGAAAKSQLTEMYLQTILSEPEIACTDEQSTPTLEKSKRDLSDFFIVPPRENNYFDAEATELLRSRQHHKPLWCKYYTYVPFTHLVRNHMLRGWSYFSFVRIF